MIKGLFEGVFSRYADSVSVKIDIHALIGLLKGFIIFKGADEALLMMQISQIML